MAYDPYVYLGTTVLKNKFGIRDQDELYGVEADLVWTRFRDIYKSDLQKLPLSEKLHKSIHKHLFEEVYPFAGKFREIDIAKNGEILYASSAFLDSSSEQTWKDINKRFATRPESVEALLEPLAMSMGDLHVLHPFREGNTRTLQLVSREIAWRAGYNVQWINADPALIRTAGTSAALGNNEPYISILRKITCEVGNEKRPALARSGGRR